MCVGGGSLGALSACGGVVAWVRLHMYSSVGGEGGRSRVKGKEKKDSWLDEKKEGCIEMQ